MKTALLVLFRSMLLPMNYHYAYSTIPMKHTQVALNNRHNDLVQNSTYTIEEKHFFNSIPQVLSFLSVSVSR